MLDPSRLKIQHIHSCCGVSWDACCMSDTSSRHISSLNKTYWTNNNRVRCDRSPRFPIAKLSEIPPGTVNAVFLKKREAFRRKHSVLTGWCSFAQNVPNFGWMRLIRVYNTALQLIRYICPSLKLKQWSSSYRRNSSLSYRSSDVISHFMHCGRVWPCFARWNLHQKMDAYISMWKDFQYC